MAADDGREANGDVSAAAFSANPFISTAVGSPTGDEGGESDKGDKGGDGDGDEDEDSFK